MEYGRSRAEPVQESSGVSVFGDATMRVTPSSAELAENLPAGSVRYVFEGSGSVSAGGQSYALEPNTLVEAVEATDVVWTTSCPVMVVASSEYDSPTRVAARAALPFIFGGLAVVGALAAVLSGKANLFKLTTHVAVSRQRSWPHDKGDTVTVSRPSAAPPPPPRAAVQRRQLRS